MSPREITTAVAAPATSSEMASREGQAPPTMEAKDHTAADGLPLKGKPIVPRKKDLSASAVSPETVPSPTASPSLVPQTSQPRPSTPNLYSAASSMIFERDVQEPVGVSDAIPAHIKTEDLIPPALEASSLAITDDHLNPEEVEIITHVTHQAAADTIANNMQSTQSSVAGLPVLSPDLGDQQSLHRQEDPEAGYSNLDPNDVKRLSFISFADVVHGDQSHHPPTLHPESSFSPGSQTSRPISPIRSPLSVQSQPLSADLASPPTSASFAGSVKGGELSPPRSLTASPPGLSASPQQRGDIAIETMGQALRKTASRDLSGFVNKSPSSSMA